MVWVFNAHVAQFKGCPRPRLGNPAGVQTQAQRAVTDVRHPADPGHRNQGRSARSVGAPNLTEDANVPVGCEFKHVDPDLHALLCDHLCRRPGAAKAQAVRHDRDQVLAGTQERIAKRVGSLDDDLNVEVPCLICQNVAADNAGAQCPLLKHHLLERASIGCGPVQRRAGDAGAARRVCNCITIMQACQQPDALPDSLIA